MRSGGEGRGFSAIVKEEIYSRSWNERTVERKKLSSKRRQFPRTPLFSRMEGTKKGQKYAVHLQC